MGYRNREIELKLLVKNNSSFKDVSRLVFDNFKVISAIKGASRDIYWKAPKSKKDFIRVRYLEDGRSQITLKKIDKGSTLDRIEIDLETASPKQSIILLEALLGKPMGSVKKKYHVYWVGDTETNISIYRVDKSKNIYIEIESTKISTVDRLRRRLKIGAD